MPRNEHSDQRYEVTREDVLRAVGPVEPNPLSGLDNPDPFGHNERPWTEFMIAIRIVGDYGLRCPINQPGRALKRNRMRELLAEMVADGSLVGHTRKEWYEMGREYPSRASDILYAHPDLVERWLDASRRIGAERN